MNWTKQGAAILSVYLYGFGATIAPLSGFIAATDPIQFTLNNLIMWPALGGFIAVFPRLGKVFSEYANMEEKNA